MAPKRRRKAAYEYEDEDDYLPPNRERQLLYGGVGLLVLAVFALVFFILFNGQPTPPPSEPTFPSEGIEEIRNQTPTAVAEEAVAEGIGSGGRFRGAWYELYFTQPVYPDNAAKRQPSLDAALVNFMGQAKKTLDVAIYDFDLSNVAEAMVAAKKRGVQVRMVMDNDTLKNKDEKIQAAIAKVKAAEIPLVDDNRTPIMHNKFTIVDNERVATGSWNYTEGDTFRLNNNLIIVNVAQIAQNYTATFEKMFTQKIFGAKRESGIPFPVIQITNSARIETYFAPEDKCIQAMITKINEAKRSIYFMAFSFTQKDLGNAIIEKAKTGVKVEGVFEKTGSQTASSQFGVMKAANVNNLQVFTDGNPYVMHHKVIIVDERYVLFGSFNFSDNASRSNDENLLIVDDPNLARAFKAEYDKVSALAKKVNR
jgi:phosphatidylserine/phosphatidylglycerophosphate/cardiolipin synthase-like enzyme